MLPTILSYFFRKEGWLKMDGEIGASSEAKVCCSKKRAKPKIRAVHLNSDPHLWSWEMIMTKNDIPLTSSWNGLPPHSWWILWVNENSSIIQCFGIIKKSQLRCLSSRHLPLEVYMVVQLGRDSRKAIGFYAAHSHTFGGLDCLKKNMLSTFLKENQEY